MSYTFKKLVTPQKVASGVAENCFFAPRADFATIAVPTAPFTNQGDSITITGDHTFGAGKGFLAIQLAPQKNSLESKTRGDLGLNGLITDLKFFIPGSYKEVHEQSQKMLNTPMIFLIADSESTGEDEFYQLGSDALGAYMTIDFTTGTTKDGVKGFMGTITYDAAVQFYTGTVTVI